VIISLIQDFFNVCKVKGVKKVEKGETLFPVIANLQSNPDVLICTWIASFLEMTGDVRYYYF